MASINKIAFLHLIDLDHQTVMRGGILVTDTYTRPLEFRCTSAIRFTEIQRILYGAKLNHYICNDLVGEPIIRDLINRPQLLFVRLVDFLRIRPTLDIPMLFLEDNNTEDNRSIKIRAFENYKSDLEIAQPVLDLYKTNVRELTEPFDRLYNAVHAAHNQNLLEKK